MEFRLQPPARLQRALLGSERDGRHGMKTLMSPRSRPRRGSARSHARATAPLLPPDRIRETLRRRLKALPARGDQRAPRRPQAVTLAPTLMGNTPPVPALPPAAGGDTRRVTMYPLVARQCLSGCYFLTRSASPSAQARATSESAFSCPGILSQPPFSMNSPLVQLLTSPNSLSFAS
jgi:hypothetical protein